MSHTWPRGSPWLWHLPAKPAGQLQTGLPHAVQLGWEQVGRMDAHNIIQAIVIMLYYRLTRILESAANKYSFGILDMKWFDDCTAQCSLLLYKVAD